jgi:hypothetical protein
VIAVALLVGAVLFTGVEKDWLADRIDDVRSFLRAIRVMHRAAVSSRDLREFVPRPAVDQPAARVRSRPAPLLPVEGGAGAIGEIA